MRSYGRMGSFQIEDLKFLDYADIGEDMSKKAWECRNLTEVRKWMVNPEPIPYESHIRFVGGLKDRVDAKYYVVLHDGEFVGSVNIHMDGDAVAERGIYIHPGHWGKGLAKKICKVLYSYLHDNCGINKITTKVMKDNIGSNSLEQSLGAQKISEDERFIYYNCDLRKY